MGSRLEQPRGFKRVHNIGLPLETITTLEWVAGDGPKKPGVVVAMARLQDA